MDLAEVPMQRQRIAPSHHATEVRETLQRSGLRKALTPRQRDALDAAISCNTMRAAARTCGMQPRDFRRSLGSIGRRARALLDDPANIDPMLPGCEPGMAV